MATNTFYQQINEGETGSDNEDTEVQSNFHEIASFCWQSDVCQIEVKILSYSFWGSFCWQASINIKEHLQNNRLLVFIKFLPHHMWPGDIKLDKQRNSLGNGRYSGLQRTIP